MNNGVVQVVICGSGCAGSLLAWILARHDLRVVLIDQGQHPRFAIGESSTPLADFLLEQISDEYRLPELKPLARWGSWKRICPQLDVGKKRGFSYFGHRAAQPFRDTDQHTDSLLVAASTHDEVSDTHWMRADVDRWLCEQAIAAGAEYFHSTRLSRLARDAQGWIVDGQQQQEKQTNVRWRAPWIIDATGGSAPVLAAAGVARCDDELSTRTGSLFGHFTGVQAMDDWLKKQTPGVETSAPFSSDDAAQHHVLEDGWMWMLRFDSGVTSVGITRPTMLWQAEGQVDRDPNAAWQAQLQRYPTLADLMSRARLVNPRTADSVRLGWMPRISRLWAAAAGEGWLALPSTVGVIDPLHSTGLAHALSGVLRAAQIILNPKRQDARAQLAAYSHDVVQEVRWIDQLVSTCYAGLPDFQLFTAACTFYFLAAVTCEQQLRDTGRMEQGFLGAKHDQWKSLLNETADKLRSRQPHSSPVARAAFIDQLRRDVEAWNAIGLLDPSFRNRYARTATKV